LQDILPGVLINKTVQFYFVIVIAREDSTNLLSFAVHFASPSTHLVPSSH